MRSGFPCLFLGHAWERFGAEQCPLPYAVCARCGAVAHACNEARPTVVDQFGGETCCRAACGRGEGGGAGLEATCEVPFCRTYGCQGALASHCPKLTEGGGNG